MPRRPRSEPTDGVFHAAARCGAPHEVIVVDDLDRTAFVVRLGRVTGRWGWTIHAWVLMTTHYHLVVETELGALSAGMRELNGGHARRFNERHGRRGHLFGSRFTAESITTDEYFEAACAYVLANPVRAGLCASPEDWRWGGLGTPTPRR